ncbi:MAG: hypothetical protein EBU36_06975 [Verrucomicrobia bacterium]|nr:hypothetical protein [Verrucomicrobiota bacterium]
MIALQFGLSIAFFVLFIGYFLAGDSRKRIKLSIALTLALSALCLSSLFKKDESGQWKVTIKPGLDLRGGTQFLLEYRQDWKFQFSCNLSGDVNFGFICIQRN